MTKMNAFAAEAEAKAGHSCDREMERDKGRRRNGASRLFSDWQDYLLVSQFLVGGEGEKTLGGGEE